MMFFKKEELRLLWPFYLERFVFKLFYLLPAFMVVYFTDLGFSMFQIGLLVGMWPLFSLIFDIPTGAIADNYGRKFSVLLGLFLAGIGFLILYFYDNFYLLLATMAFIGISFTFISGADNAWVTDLLNKKHKRLLHHYFAKSMSLSSLGLVLSGIIGAILVKSYGTKIIWLVSSIAFFISVIILLFADENYTKRNLSLKKSILETNKQTKTSFKYLYKNKILFLILIAGIIFVFASSFSNTLTWVPLLKGLGYPDYAFGYFISAISFIGIFAPLIPLKIMKKGKERKFLLYCFVFSMIFIFGIIFAYNIQSAVIMILGFSLFQYLSNPVSIVYFQKFISSELRATIGSIQSTLISLVGIISLPLVGYLVDNIGAQYTIFLSGFIMIPGIIIYIKLKKFEK